MAVSYIKSWRKDKRRSRLRRNGKKRSNDSFEEPVFEPEILDEEGMLALQETIDHNSGIVILTGARLKRYEERMLRLREIFAVTAKIPHNFMRQWEAEGSQELTSETTSKINSHRNNTDMINASRAGGRERERKEKDIGKWIEEGSKASNYTSSLTSTSEQKLLDDDDKIGENPENPDIHPLLPAIKSGKNFVESNYRSKFQGDFEPSATNSITKSMRSSYKSDQVEDIKIADLEFSEEKIHRATPKANENREVRKPYPEGMDEGDIDDDETEDEPLGSVKPHWDINCPRLEKTINSYSLTPRITSETNRCQSVADSADFSIDEMNGMVGPNLFISSDSEVSFSNINNRIITTSESTWDERNQRDNMTKFQSVLAGQDSRSKRKVRRSYFRDLETQSVMQSKDYDVAAIKQPRTPLTSEGNIFEEIQFAVDTLETGKIKKAVLNMPKSPEYSSNKRPQKITKAYPSPDTDISSEVKEESNSNLRHSLQEAVVTATDFVAVTPQSESMWGIEPPTRLVYENQESHHIIIADDTKA